MHLEGHLNAEGQEDNRLHFIARQRSGVKAENDIMSDMKTIAENVNDFAELKRWYNGYRFSTKNPVTVYNPVSLGLTFAHPDDEFHGTWTQTGRASTLMNYIKREEALQVDLDGVVSAVESDFDVTDLDNMNPIGMLYQTGYLTIADYSQGLYQLRVPDEEVKRDIAALLAGAVHERLG